jgi:cyanophycin synthetase
MRLFSVIDESMSFIAGRAIAGNKQVTNAIVKSIGINVPDELYINPTILHEDPDTVDAFIKSHGKVVAKPIDGAHGKAVYINLDSLQQVMDCAQAILQESRFDGFLVQQQLTGFDVRVVCIDGVYASAMTRVPATVIGDGVHTVEQLIDIENGQSDRGGDDYNTLYNKIDMKYVTGNRVMHNFLNQGRNSFAVNLKINDSCFPGSFMNAGEFL